MIAKRVLTSAFISLIFFLGFPFWAFAGAQRFHGEYRYESSGKEGYYGSRVLAQRRLKDLLLHDAAGYLFVSGYLDRSGLDGPQAVMISSFFTVMEITDEKWDANAYSVSGHIEIEPQRLSREINSRIASGNGVREAVELKIAEAALLEEISMRLGAASEDGAWLRAAFRRLDALFDIEEASGLLFAGREGAANEAFGRVEAGFPEYSPYMAAFGYTRRKMESAQVQDDKIPYRDPVLMRLDSLISRAPDDYRLYFERGSRYYDLRRYDKALADLDKASILNPRYLPSYKLKARIYEYLGDFIKAQGEYNKALSFSRGDYDFYFERGREEEFKGLYLFAINNYTEAIRIRPSDPRGYLARAKVYLKLDPRSEEGIKDMKKAARLGSDEARGFLKKKGIKWQ